MDTILFTGGASGVTESILPLDLSHLTCKFVGCKDQEERSSGPNAPNYSEKVLVGNWFERRSVYRQPIDEWITVYNTHYKPHGVKDPIDDVFTVWKNKQKIQGVDRLPIIDGDTYLDNMTSAYDLSYRILPRDLCGPRFRVYNARYLCVVKGCITACIPSKMRDPNVWVPEADLTLGYGNLTKYGLVDALKAKKDNALRRDGTSTWKSVYKNDYKEPIVITEERNSKRFPKPHGDLNTPDLRHLGITLPSTTRPSVPEPQYRSPAYEKICTRI